MEETVKPTILIVGNQRDVCDVLQRMLNHIAPRYECVTTSDTQHVLKLLAERDVVLAFVHVGFQDLAGLPVATTIKTRSPTTRVVLLSALDEGDLKRHAEVLKLDGYLAKPFIVADVAQIVSTLLP
jgi:DNA-binding response OmpR family regulator